MRVGSSGKVQAMRGSSLILSSRRLRPDISHPRAKNVARRLAVDVQSKAFYQSSIRKSARVEIDAAPENEEPPSDPGMYRAPRVMKKEQYISLHIICGH